jgi:SAM-dependent methyltransferase
MPNPAPASTWNRVWDEIFRSRPWGKYPKEELIRFVARNYYQVPDRKAVRFLDLGCGYGSSAWYLAREGFTVDGIDGSAVVIDLLRQRLDGEGVDATLAVGDIIDLPYPKETFDCVIDVGCLTCNGPDETRRILDGVFECLKPGGRLFSFTPTDRCWGAGCGQQVAKHTYRDVTEGPFSNTGISRFSSEAQIRDLYSRFGDLRFELSEYTVCDRAHTLSHWVVEGTKR